MATLNSSGASTHIVRRAASFKEIRPVLRTITGGLSPQDIQGPDPDQATNTGLDWSLIIVGVALGTVGTL